MNHRLTHIPIHLVEQFMRIVRRTAVLENRPWHFGTSEMLYRSEIFLLELVGDHEGISVTGAAEKLAVTKGAVSQTLKKLDKKGLVAKRNDPENSVKAALYLTNKGKSAYYAHKHWHDMMDGGFRDYFSGMNKEQVAVLSEFLNQYERFLERWEAMLNS